jgi:hypothetical protein
MACRIFLLVVFASLCSCSAPRPMLPDLAAGASRGSESRSCGRLWPSGDWQFVHSITFQFDGAQPTTVLGVTVFSAGEGRCVLTTLEGLTLFEARWRDEGVPQIKRALPPFDKPPLAAGLLRDVKMIFTVPGVQGKQGLAADHNAVCRYAAGDLAGDVTDVVWRQDNCWTINRYAEGRLTKRVVAGDCSRRDDGLLPRTLRLEAFGNGTYLLTMTLLSAERLNS